MFKRFILALACLSFTISGFAAKLTATLQSGDKVTPFYGSNAFVEAYNAAVNGDIITLSPGEFNATNIEKSITVIGTYAFSDDLSRATRFSASVTISADDVTLEGIRFTNNSTDKGVIIKGTDNLTINRCYIALLNDEAKTAQYIYHNNTILTDCYINDYNAMSLSQNAVLRNCSVNYFNDMNKVKNPALIENCNVSYFASYNKYSPYYHYYQPYAIYRNCCLGLLSNRTYEYYPSLNFSVPSEFYNNCFYSRYYYHTFPDWNIQYGSATHRNNVIVRINGNGSSNGIPTLIPAEGSFTPYTYNGVSYGPADHKSYPAIPSIISTEIDTKTDAEGNLHVKITATARD